MVSTSMMLFAFGSSAAIGAKASAGWSSVASADTSRVATRVIVGVWFHNRPNSSTRSATGSFGASVSISRQLPGFSATWQGWLRK